MEVAKCLMVSKTKVADNFVFEHTTNSKVDAKKAAIEQHPDYRVARCWVGQKGAHKLARLPDSNSKLVKSLMESSKKENVLFDEGDY